MSIQNRAQIKLVQRIRRLRGQLDALERLVAAEDDCNGQLMLLAAIRGGINGLMGEILETHIRFHLTDGSQEQVGRRPDRPGPRLPEVDPEARRVLTQWYREVWRLNVKVLLNRLVRKRHHSRSSGFRCPLSSIGDPLC